MTGMPIQNQREQYGAFEPGPAVRPLEASYGYDADAAALASARSTFGITPGLNDPRRMARTASDPRDRAGDAWRDGKDRGQAEHGRHDQDYRDSDDDIHDEVEFEQRDRDWQNYHMGARDEVADESGRESSRHHALGGPADMMAMGWGEGPSPEGGEVWDDELGGGFGEAEGPIDPFMPGAPPATEGMDGPVPHVQQDWRASGDFPTNMDDGTWGSDRRPDALGLAY